MTQTKVYIVAFELSLSDNISVGNFYDWLVFYDDKKIKVNGYSNYIFVREHKNYITGTVICFKGDKKILATNVEKSFKSVDKIHLKKNQESTKASMFCIDPTSLRGMFYSAHGEVGATLLSKIFKKIHNEGRDRSIKEKSKEFAKGRDPDKKHKKLANNYFGNSFLFEVLVTPNDIKTLVNKYSEINRINLSISPALDEESIFRPALNLAKSQSLSINLRGESEHKNRISAILNIWDKIKHKNQIKALKLFGKSLTGEVVEEILGENVLHFYTEYLDDFIENLPDRKWKDYTSSKALEKLIEIVKENPAVIPPPKPIDTWKENINKNDINYYLEKKHGYN